MDVVNDKTTTKQTLRVNFVADVFSDKPLSCVTLMMWKMCRGLRCQVVSTIPFISAGLALCKPEMFYVRGIGNICIRNQLEGELLRASEYM